MILPEIREIQVFLALTRTNSFSSAAKELGITQPAVSAHIYKLEQLMGFPLFHRLPEGATMTEQGRLILPHVEKLHREYVDLMRRADYWNRSQTQEVKIWADGSYLSQGLKSARSQQIDPAATEIWRDLDPKTEWKTALKNFETDVVITGSFLKSGESPGIKVSPITAEAGLTVAWNPDYYAFDKEDFSFPDALSASIILPTESLATGFREFLSNWCETTYGQRIVELMEFNSEHEAAEACRLGLGILIFPGEAATRMRLQALGLATHPGFGFLLPKAFTFGIRWRANEQNPVIASTVRSLMLQLSGLKTGSAA